MVVNKRKGDTAGTGAVEKRPQLKTRLGSATAWIKLDKKSGKFVVVMQQAKKTKAAKKVNAVRVEKKRVRSVRQRA